MNKSKSGFTIIELLIVIVVIAILAAITVVAYNGIQQRARDSKVITAVNAYVKILKMYKADHGNYPYPPDVAACLGNSSDHPAVSGFTQGVCYKYDTGEVAVNTTFNSELSKYASGSLPSGETARVDYSGDVSVRGLWYFNFGSAVILYSVGQSTKCVIGTLTESSSDGNQYCQVVLP